MKNSLAIVLICFLIIVVAYVSYKAGKLAGENSIKIILAQAEKELVFQKKKEATREAEYKQLLKIYKEKKQAEEKRWREKQKAEFDREMAKLLKESMDRRTEIYMKLMETIMTSTQYPLMPDYPATQSSTKQVRGNDLLPETTTPISAKIILMSIIYNEKESSAFINDKIVHEGDMIHGVKVVKIHKNKVEFEKNGRTWTQTLNETPGPE